MNKLIFLDPSVPATSISRNDAVTRRASICLVGVLTYTRSDWLWANWYALVMMADVILVLDRVSELVADVAVGASLATLVPLLFHAHQRTFSHL